MQAILTNLNAAALVLGYFVLLGLLISIILCTLTVSRRIVFEWRYKRFQEKEWDNRASSWVFETPQPHTRHDTDVFYISEPPQPEYEEVYDQEKEQYRDAS